MTNAQEDHVMFAVAGVLTLAAVGGFVGAVKLFENKRTLAGVLVVLASLGAGLVALGLAAVVVFSWSVWR